MWKLTFRSAQALQDVFQGMQRLQEGVSTELQEIAGEIALWVRRRNVCGACQDPEHPRESDMSPVSHTEANCSRRYSSLLAPTYQVMLKAERIHQMLILKMKFDLPTASFCTSFSVDKEESQYSLFLGSFVLATNTYLHEAQHYQGSLMIS